MWSRIFLGIIGLCAGVTVAAAVLSLAAAVGIYPRLAAKSRSADHILLYETVAEAGIIVGSFLSVYDVILPKCGWLTGIAGFFIGIYVGCLLMALAEVLQAYPIAFRRLNIKEGLQYMVFFVALGKLCGSLYYFSMEMWK